MEEACERLRESMKSIGSPMQGRGGDILDLLPTTMLL